MFYWSVNLPFFLSLYIYIVCFYKIYTFTNAIQFMVLRVVWYMYLYYDAFLLYTCYFPMLCLYKWGSVFFLTISKPGNKSARWAGISSLSYESFVWPGFIFEIWPRVLSKLSEVFMCILKGTHLNRKLRMKSEWNKITQ